MVHSKGREARRQKAARARQRSVLRRQTQKTAAGAQAAPPEVRALRGVDGERHCARNGNARPFRAFTSHVVAALCATPSMFWAHGALAPVLQHGRGVTE